MALADNMTKEQRMFDEDYQSNKSLPAAPGEMSDDDKETLSIMVDQAQQAIEQGGADVIQQAMSGSKNPAQVIAQFILQLGSQIADSMDSQGMPVNPQVMLNEGGFVEQVSDFLQSYYDIPKDVMDQAEKIVGAAAMSMHQAESAPQGQQAPAAPEQPANRVPLSQSMGAG